MSKPARAVISDFGGVLTNPLIEAFAAYQEHSGVRFEDLGRAMQAATEARGGEHPLFLLEKGLISEAEFLQRLEEHLPEGTRLEGFRDTYFDALHPNAELIAFMRELRDRGLRMAMLTNNVREWEPHWRSKLPDIDDIFELVVDSAFVGMRKPEPEIYHLTLERMGGGLTPEDCVFLDDLELNVEAARELGMRAVRYQSNAQAIPEIEQALRA
jgi:epoxide hydrolase-like predicted phosphatase